jgi:hypothetical protein
MSKRRARRPIHNPSDNTLLYVAIGGALVVSAAYLFARSVAPPF